MLRIFLLLVGVICSCGAALAAEMVDNPNDPKSWKFEVQQATAELKTEQGALRIDISNASNEPWHVQMYQGDKSVVKGRTYTLRFSAKATEDRPIIVLGQGQDGPWPLLTEFTRIDIGREWKQHSIDLTMKDAPGMVRFPVIQVGQRAGTIWFRDISVLEAGEKPAVRATVPVVTTGQNGAVEHMKPTPEPANWVLDQQAAAKGTLRSEDASLRIDVTQPGTERSHLKLYQQEKDLVAGQSYVMKFIAKATTPRKVGLAVQSDQSPYESLIPDEEVEFSTRWQLYTIEFVPEKTVPKHTRMPVLELGGETGTVWLRSVSVSGPAAR